MSTIKIVDASTGEEIEREMNAKELKEHQAFTNDYEKLQSELAAQASSKSALLTRLGITADEAALLLG